MFQFSEYSDKQIITYFYCSCFCHPFACLFSKINPLLRNGSDLNFWSKTPCLLSESCKLTDSLSMRNEWLLFLEKSFELLTSWST